MIDTTCRQCTGPNCLTLIPRSAKRTLCQFCTRSLELDRAKQERADRLDTLEAMANARPLCECGGVNDSDLHEQSLLHKRFLWDRNHGWR